MLGKRKSSHASIVHRGCYYKWNSHGCGRVDAHTQHLCDCGGWTKNENAGGRPVTYLRNATP